MLMKRALLLMALVLVLLQVTGTAQTSGFVQSECGMIQNPDYYYENYFIGSHGAGYRLYHNGVIIADTYEQFGGPQGQELRFWDDTTGLFVVSYGFISSTLLYRINNNEVTLVSTSPGFIYDLFVASRHTWYFATLAEPPLFTLVTRISDLGPAKTLADPLTTDTTVMDTVMGMTFCPGLDRLDYFANMPGDTHTIAILLHVDTLLSVPRSEAAELSVFPNPAGEYVHLRSTQDYGHLEIKILDNQGRMRKRFELKASEDIELFVGDLESGVYFLVFGNDRVRQIYKLIKS
jgi:hypothetical protein